MEDLLISTTRLKIQKLDLSHLTAFHHYRSDPEVTQYQGFDVFSIEQAQQFILEQSQLNFGKPGEWSQYALINVKTDQLIGDCAIKLDAQDSRIAEIGITITPKEQRKGYAKETILGIMTFLFETKNIHRIVEIVDAENTASIGLLKSIGFRLEGHFIENIFFKGKWGSEYQFAMLKWEWLKRK